MRTVSAHIIRRSRHHVRSTHHLPQANIIPKQKASRKTCFLFWQGREDSNPRPTVLETGTLPTELHPCIQRLTLYHIPSHFAIPFLKIFLFFYFPLSLYIFLFLYNCSPSLKAPLSEQKTQKLLCASAFFMCPKAYLCILPEPSPFASFSTSATLTIL